MVAVKLTLLLMILLVSYASAGPQKKKSGKIYVGKKNSFGISAGADRRGNPKIGLDFKHNLN